jgi:hypothetical protein
MSKIITSHLTLSASVEDVWETLIDLDGYRTWNPFITSGAGTVGVGERLELKIQLPGGRALAFKPWITAVEPHHYLEWLGHLGLPGIFDGRHSFRLTPRTAGRTLVQQSETFTGVLIPFAGPVLARTQAGFEAMNAALAGHAAASATRGADGPPWVAP